MVPRSHAFGTSLAGLKGVRTLKAVFLVLGALLLGYLVYRIGTGPVVEALGRPSPEPGVTTILTAPAPIRPRRLPVPRRPPRRG